MGTLGGTGTLYCGWRHEADGVAVATEWAVLCWLPIVPLARYRLRIPSDPDEEPVVSLRGIASVGGAAEIVDSFQRLERLPLDWRSVAWTYLKAWLLFPLLIAAPFAIVAAGLYGLVKAGMLDADGVAFMYAAGVAFAACLGFALAVGATLLHRARGGRK